MARVDGRGPNELREVVIQAGVNPYAEGSARCSFGLTQVLCTASLEKGVPPWLEGRGMGWVTAEYAMLPRATHTRTGRDHQSGGRAREISRLLGRSLRAAVDLAALAGYTIRLDCDVMVADGGTRTASVSGAWVALAGALARLELAPAMQVAAISLGRVDGDLLVDLCYAEDSRAELDLNLVATSAGELVEVQSTAEKGVFSPGELASLVEMGLAASQHIFARQRAALAGA